MFLVSDGLLNHNIFQKKPIDMAGDDGVKRRFIGPDGGVIGAHGAITALPDGKLLTKTQLVYHDYNITEDDSVTGKIIGGGRRNGISFTNCNFYVGGNEVCFLESWIE